MAAFGLAFAGAFFVGALLTLKLREFPLGTSSPSVSISDPKKSRSLAFPWTGLEYDFGRDFRGGLVTDSLLFSFPTGL
jgi:hypothetical protein